MFWVPGTSIAVNFFFMQQRDISDKTNFSSLGPPLILPLLLDDTGRSGSLYVDVVAIKSTAHSLFPSGFRVC